MRRHLCSGLDSQARHLLATGTKKQNRVNLALSTFSWRAITMDKMRMTSVENNEDSKGKKDEDHGNEEKELVDKEEAPSSHLPRVVILPTRRTRAGK